MCFVIAATSVLVGNLDQTMTMVAANRPFVSPLFTDHMVLQRGRKNPIWGWTHAGTKVTVELAGNSTSAVAGTDGKWTAWLQPQPTTGSYSIKVTADGNSTVFSDVLFGDVWICSGQSNMEMGLTLVQGGAEEVAAANHPKIRLFTVARQAAGVPLDTPRGAWSVCTPLSVQQGAWGGFSAVGYFFGRDLQDKLNVPIGLILTCLGGSTAEAWTSAGALRQMPEFKNVKDDQEVLTPIQLEDAHEQLVRDTEHWCDTNDPLSRETPTPAAVDFDDREWKTMALPNIMEQAGLPNYDGVVWFRRTFDLDVADVNKDIILHVAKCDDRDTTWVNGVRVGGMTYWGADRIYQVPASILRAGRNVVTVRVLDTGGTGGICGDPNELYLAMADGAHRSLAGEWRYQDSLPLSNAPAPPADTVNTDIYTDAKKPAVLYNGMLAPIVPYGIKGVIWYQGENNIGRADEYRRLLPVMIDDWRKQWGQGDFPFLINQLANYGRLQISPSDDPLPHDVWPQDDDWARLCEAQATVAATVANSGLSVSVDLGEANDIHAKRKKEVGQRLALVALAKVYHKDIEYSGPMCIGHSIQGDQVTLTFSHASGLRAKDGHVQGFAIAGEDRHFVWADAKIEGNTVIVSSPHVQHPVAVRYAWAANPICSLYNSAGLPACPFRIEPSKDKR